MSGGIKRLLTARAGALLQLVRPKPRETYVLYVSKLDDSRQIVSPRIFSTRDEAASACISLPVEGYKVWKVKLPSGRYVMGSHIEWSIRLGADKVKIALTR